LFNLHNKVLKKPERLEYYIKIPRMKADNSDVADVLLPIFTQISILRNLSSMTRIAGAFAFSHAVDLEREGTPFARSVLKDEQRSFLSLHMFWGGFAE
jgi:hypothetical protein